MNAPFVERIHGTVVVPPPMRGRAAGTARDAAAGSGVLLLGPSGSGKSDLALRVLEAGGELVGDDRVVLTAENGRLTAVPEPNLSGLLEVRGLGIVAVPYLSEARVAAAVYLVPGGQIERMPDSRTVALCGVSIPRVHLDPFEASAAAKLRLALGIASGDISIAI